ncbi:MAG: acyl-CoA desaturase, partial [Bacteroidota bacterium]
MNAVKFKGNEEWQKLFWQTTRNKVHAYFKDQAISTKANPAMVFKTISMLCFYLIPYILFLTTTVNAWVGLGLALVMGIGKAGIGMSVMHDGLHGSYSEKKNVNKIVGASMYLIGSNVFNWKIQHNIYHHAYTNIAGHDEDIQTRWILRLSEHTPLKRIHRFQHVYGYLLYSLMTFSMLFGDITQLITYNKTGITKKHHSNPVHELVKVTLIKTIYLLMMLVLPMVITPFAWWQVLTGFILMHLTAGFILSLVFQLAHITEGALQPLPNEDGITANEWAVHQLLTTSDFAPENHLLNWYVGGLNFQVVHHLFPNICHIHYSKISPIIRE